MLVRFEEQRAEPHSRRQKVVVLGSTGSIGCAALDIIRSNPEQFEVLGLSAGRNANLLREQVLEFQPKYVNFAADNLPSFEPVVTKPILGVSGLTELASLPEADVILNGIVGSAALPGTFAAVKAGKRLALANKESLVVAGAAVAKIAKVSGAQIIPVDSEHAALFQMLKGIHPEYLKAVILTASGGPFLRRSLEQLSDVTPDEAKNHPTWKMGGKISIDSATMFNKALEVIEAASLYRLPPARIKVLIHPQSIVHSLIELIDGTQLAQLSRPDMKAPIAHALTYPMRMIPDVVPPLDLGLSSSLEFESVDTVRFKAIPLAYRALEQGGGAGAVLHFANEVAVELFCERRIKFTDIYRLVEQALDGYQGVAAPNCYEDCLELQAQVGSMVRDNSGSI